MSATSCTRSASKADGGDVVRWVACFAVVLLAHAGIAAAIALYKGSEPVGASDLPAVVMIDMLPPAATPEPPAESPPSEARPEAAAPEPTPDPVPETPAEAPAPEIPTPPETPPPEPMLPEPVAPPPEPVVTSDVAPPHPSPPVETPAVEEIAPPTPVTPNPAVALPPRPPEALPPPNSKPAPNPEPVARKPPPKPVQATRRTERQVARRPPAEASGTRAPSQNAAAASASSAASRSSWQSQLVGHLQRSLRYPPGSRGGGAAFVSFSVNRQGRVTSASLARSSGSADLDAAAMVLFRSALPPPPPDVPGSSFSFTIPIRFSLR